MRIFLTFVWFLVGTVLVLAVMDCSQAKPEPKDISKIHGICFGPYLSGNPNYDGMVSVGEATKLIDQQKSYVNWIRTYTIMPMPGTAKTYGTLAKERGLKVAAGCWLAQNRANNAEELQGLIRAAKKGEVDLALVGSETLLRQDLTEEQLICYLKEVKKAVPGVAVATDDAWSEILNHPKIIAASDLIIVNIYPYWEGIAIENAIDILARHYQTLVETYPGKKIMIGETGWPSAGKSINKAVANPKNAAKYFLDFVLWARANKVDYFYFEAYNEPWKIIDEGLQGAHWGIWDTKMRMKPGFMTVFEGGNHVQKN